MAGKKHGLRISGNVLKYIEGTDTYEQSKAPYSPDEDLAVTVVRHVRSLPARADESVWATGLTADELDEIARLAQSLARVADGNATLDPIERGDLRAARTLVAHCEQLKETAPEVSRILPSSEPKPTPEPIELDPLVEKLRRAEEDYATTLAAHEAAAEARRKLLRERNAKIAKLKSGTPPRTNAEIGQMFDLDPSQVSRIKAAQATQKM